MEAREKIKILYVDDEPNNLMAFNASFRFNYNILTAVSADDALGILEQQEDIVAVISDQRMPGKSGVDFFEEMRARHPKPVRLLITGYTDIESVVASINKGNVFRYIRKPWAEDDILYAIEESHKYYMATSMLMKKNEDLQTAYNELDRFTYRVTHDLKGPIVGLKEGLKMARTETSEKNRNDLLELMSISLERLDHFVDSMFDYYRIKQGELQLTDINFETLVSNQLHMHGVTIKVNNIRFTYKIDADPTLPFRSDAVKLQVILSNLISNALKYQKKNATDKWVNLDITVKNGEAHLRVEDNGIGISEMFKHQIFDIFYRATSSEYGAGVGLYNVKDAITKLNGTIQVDSTEGKGTVFSVIIPGKI